MYDKHVRRRVFGQLSDRRARPVLVIINKYIRMIIIISIINNIIINY